MARRAALIALLVVAAVIFASPAVAAPPVLTAVGQTNRHPTATWTLPAGVKSRLVEIATDPASRPDGYFSGESVKATDGLEDGQTNWVYKAQLEPGTYYVHIGGFDEGCYLRRGMCPIPEFSQVMTLEIPSPRYQASTRTIHPHALRLPGNWTYLGDTLKLRFRNANAATDDSQTYTLCNTTARGRACRSRKLVARSWDTFRLRITRAVARRSRQYIAFTWWVEGRVVARRRVKMYWD